MPEGKGKLPVFDPTGAVREALAILDEAGAHFALAGCLAAWSCVPAEGRRLTQDVDFAVKGADMEAVLDAARRRGHAVEELAAGGYRIMVGEVPVDFIDGRPYLRELFEQAVAQAAGLDLGLDRKVPVVRRDHLFAMKAAAAGEQDEQDIRWMLSAATREEYPELRSFVLARAGYTATMVLDRVARRIGHPGAGPEQRN